MSGPPPKPRAARRRANVPVRGDWRPTPGIGWQHGPVPAPPEGLLPESQKAWATWMASWVASHWTPDDLPGLRKVVQLYDQVESGQFSRVTELRNWMDGYGITPKGQQDRRWQAPKAEAESVASAPLAAPYAGLRVAGAKVA